MLLEAGEENVLLEAGEENAQCCSWWPMSSPPATQDSVIGSASWKPAG
jgi:hypothetical protein